MFPVVCSAEDLATKARVEDYIYFQSQQWQVPTSVALAIAKAESNFNANAKNPHSSASGIFQFLDGTFKSYCINEYHLTDTLADKNDPEIQIVCAMHMLADGGYHHWDASKFIWSSSSVV